VIGVGDVRDYTGKYSVNEGNAITQGGALMVTSALGKLGGAVGLAERFDPTIAERELGYTDRRQLGDGACTMSRACRRTGKVPWLPYYGGSIARFRLLYRRRHHRAQLRHPLGRDRHRGQPARSQGADLHAKRRDRSCASSTRGPCWSSRRSA
jgi:hypothetical protein